MPHHHHHVHAEGHDHGHGHAPHGHAHAPADFGRAFAIGIALNIGFVLVEAGFGLVSQSMALLADAGHNLSDVLGLIVAWSAATLAKRPATERYTYGLKGGSILAALTNAALLLVAVGGIVWEAVQRFQDPRPVEGWTVVAVAAAGIVVNGATALLFASGREHDLNVRGAYLHMAADAAISAGVVVAGLIVIATGWLWVDPVVSLVIAAVIVWGTLGLARDSLAMSLAAVPRGIDIDGVRRALLDRPGVASLHDLHVWPVSTTETALTAHLVMPAGHPGDGFLHGIADELRHHHGIAHATLQVETDPAHCPAAAAGAA